MENNNSDFFENLDLTIFTFDFEKRFEQRQIRAGLGLGRRERSELRFAKNGFTADTELRNKFWPLTVKTMVLINIWVSKKLWRHYESWVLFKVKVVQLRSKVYLEHLIDRFIYQSFAWPKPKKISKICNQIWLRKWEIEHWRFRKFNFF